MTDSPRRLRLLVVAGWYPTKRKPVLGSFVRSQVRALAARHDVAVIAPDLRTPKAVLRHGPGRRLLIEDEDGVPVVRPRVLLARPGRPETAIDGYHRAVAAAWTALKSSWGDPDLIHAHVMQPAGAAAVTLAGSLGVPAVVTEHTGPFDPAILSDEARRLTLAALQGAARRIAVSPSLAATLEAFGGRRVDVVGNVVDPPDGRPGERGQGPPLVTFVGLMTGVKGADVLLRALSAITDDPWRLVLGGDGPARPDLEALAKRLGIGGRCRWLGLLTPQAVADTLAGADVAVVPSRYESFGMVAAEALFQGTPLVASNVGGLPFVTEGTDAGLVPADDPVALAEAIHKVLSAKRPFDGAAARSRILSRFGPEPIVTRLSSLYGEIL